MSERRCSECNGMVVETVNLHNPIYKCSRCGLERVMIGHIRKRDIVIIDMKEKV